MKKTKLLSFILAIILLTTTCFIVTNSYATEAEKIDVPETEESSQILTTGTGENTEAEGENSTALLTGEEEHDHSNETVETPDIHEGDLYVLFGEEDKTATKYVMDKMVDGNVFIMGNEVEITGQIRGNVYVFATKLTVAEDAYIAMDLYAFAQDITLSGYAFDVYAFCKNFDMTKTAVAYRDLKLYTTEAHLIGAVGRDVDLGATKITVYDDEENNFYVGNNLNYSSGSEIEHVNDIKVGGKVNFEEEKNDNETANTNVIGDIALNGVKEVVFCLAIYALLIFLAPKFVEKSKEYVSTRGLLAAAIGLAFTILVPIVAIILIFTIVGFSLATTVALVYTIVLILNSAIVVTALNEFICGKIEKINSTWKKILMIIPVSLVLSLIRQIPVVGGLVSIVVFLAGVGMIVLYQFDKKRKKDEVKE